MSDLQPPVAQLAQLSTRGETPMDIDNDAQRQTGTKRDGGQVHSPDKAANKKQKPGSAPSPPQDEELQEDPFHADRNNLTSGSLRFPSAGQMSLGIQGEATSSFPTTPREAPSLIDARLDTPTGGENSTSKPAAASGEELIGKQPQVMASPTPPSIAAQPSTPHMPIPAGAPQPPQIAVNTLPIPRNNLWEIFLNCAVLERLATPAQAELLHPPTDSTPRCIIVLANSWGTLDYGTGRRAVWTILHNTGLSSPEAILLPVGETRDARQRRPHHSVRTHVVEGLPPANLDALVAKRCLTSEMGTLFIHKLPIPVSDFVTALVGLEVEYTERIENTLTSEIRGALANNTEVLHFLHHNRDNLTFPADVDDNFNLFAQIFDTLRVICHHPPANRPDLSPLWLLFMKPSTRDPHKMAEFAELIRSRPIVTSLGSAFPMSYTTPTSRRYEFWCQVCLSLTHTKEYCHWPTLPGWIHVDFRPQPPQTNTGRGNRGNRGNRGGRGRGGRNGRGNQGGRGRNW